MKNALKAWVSWDPIQELKCNHNSEIEDIPWRGLAYIDLLASK